MKNLGQILFLVTQNLEKVCTPEKSVISILRPLPKLSASCFWKSVTSNTSIRGRDTPLKSVCSCQILFWKVNIIHWQLASTDTKRSDSLKSCLKLSFQGSLGAAFSHINHSPALHAYWVIWHYSTFPCKTIPVRTHLMQTPMHVCKLCSGCVPVQLSVSHFSSSDRKLPLTVFSTLFGVLSNC